MNETAELGFPAREKNSLFLRKISLFHAKNSLFHPSEGIRLQHVEITEENPDVRACSGNLPKRL
jgi:hypothetical protein